MGYQRIEVRPIAGALGAEVAGIDLGGSLDKQAFSEHGHRRYMHRVTISGDRPFLTACA